MNNIYVKQMQRLGLNPKQYAELIDIPYEVVKDFIYNKEGEYKMGLKELLRKNMIEKHQEVEENYEEAKIKAMGIKHSEKEIDYLDWYNNEYSVSMLKSILKLKSISEFKKNYDLLYKGERFSNWTYQLLLGKKEYAGHEIDTNKKLEFIKQLYDILINKNGDKYLRSKPFSNDSTSKTKILKWYKKFNLKKYIESKNMTQSDFSRETGVSTGVISKLINNPKSNYITTNLVTIYNYVMSNPTEKIETPKIDENDIMSWFRNFNFNDFRRKYKMPNEVIAENCGLSHSTIAKMSQGTYSSLSAIIKFHDYVKSLEEEPMVEEEPIEEENDDIELLDIFNEEPVEEPMEDDNNTASKIMYFEEPIEPKCEINIPSDNILKKILVNRLTEEEKELIRIFGGNLEI